MKRNLLVALGVGALMFAGSQAAMAGVSVGLGFGVPAPVYVSPAPTYVAPVPVYAPPPEPPEVAYQAVPVVAPVYVAPAAAYVAPVPVVVPAVYIGWHGDRYWDGNRWWGRRDWYAHRH